MHRRSQKNHLARPLAAAGGFVVLLVAGVALLAAINRSDPHRGLADCGSCHLAGDAASTANAAQLIATQEVLCGRCHQDALQLSHPTGFVPARPLTAEYPADWKGELTCSTCHEVHGTTPGLLRGTRRAREFCLACHNPGFFSQMKDEGTSIVISGHLDVGRGRGTFTFDSYSLHCLGCHADGFADSDGSVTLNKVGIVRHASGSAPHPIGRAYRDAAREGGFKPESQLASRHILLPGGQVSCVSCHEAYTQDHGKLVMSNTGSALCLSCHAK